jgi:NADH-quinone oxidoreductase subunit L
MTVPLVVLAGLALVGGLMNLPFTDKLERLALWLEPTIVGEHELPDAAVLWILAFLAIAGAVLGVFVAYRVYQEHKGNPARIEQPVLAHAWYIDDTYAKVVGGPGEASFQGVADFDQAVIDGAVNEVGKGTRGLGDLIRPVQTGLVRTYALGVAIGAGLLLAFVVTRMNV